jgi:hypothetical protein
MIQPAMTPAGELRVFDALKGLTPAVRFRPIATIIPKDFDDFTDFLQHTIQPTMIHRMVSVGKWALSPSCPSRNWPCTASFDS